MKVMNTNSEAGMFMKVTNTNSEEGNRDVYESYQY
jgi:hypothetical protein